MQDPATTKNNINIVILRDPPSEDVVEQLVRLSIDIVDASAHLGWNRPLEPKAAEEYWHELTPRIRAREHLLLLATFADRVVGTVQMERAHFPTSRHRGEVAKLMVHPDFRRRNIANTLMDVLEEQAIAWDIELLFLDTRSGEPAEHFYERRGYHKTGYVPGWMKYRDGTYRDTVFYYKHMGARVFLPNSPACVAAIGTAQASLSREVFNHSVRSFLFACFLAEARDISIDKDLLCVANVMHDIGLASKYRSGDRRFEIDGAEAARTLLRQFNYTEEACQLAWDAIALHSSGGIARWKQPLVALTQAGVVTDVHGAYLDELRADDVRAVLNAYPRDNFESAFLDALTDIATAKPATGLYNFVGDVGMRCVEDYRLPNFVDEFRHETPFKKFQK